jgi:hypothetical protein
VLNPSHPLFHSSTKGKREEEELMQGMHCKDNDVMVGAVVMVKALFCVFCVFLWMGLGKIILLQMKFV